MSESPSSPQENIETLGNTTDTSEDGSEEIVQANKEQSASLGAKSPASSTLHRLRKYSDHREYSVSKRKRKSVPGKKPLEGEDIRESKRRKISLLEDTPLSEKDDRLEFLSSSGEIVNKPKLRVDEFDDYLIEDGTHRSLNVSNIDPSNESQRSEVDNSTTEFVSSSLFSNGTQTTAPQVEEGDSIAAGAADLFNAKAHSLQRESADLNTSVDVGEIQSDYIVDSEPILHETTTEEQNQNVDDFQEIEDIESDHESLASVPEGERDHRPWYKVVSRRFRRSPIGYTILLIFLLIVLALLALYPINERNIQQPAEGGISLISRSLDSSARLEVEEIIRRHLAFDEWRVKYDVENIVRSYLAQANLDEIVKPNYSSQVGIHDIEYIVKEKMSKPLNDLKKDVQEALSQFSGGNVQKKIEAMMESRLSEITKDLKVEPSDSFSPKLLKEIEGLISQFEEKWLSTLKALQNEEAHSLKSEVQKSLSELESSFISGLESKVSKEEALDKAALDNAIENLKAIQDKQKNAVVGDFDSLKQFVNGELSTLSTKLQYLSKQLTSSSDASVEQIKNMNDATYRSLLTSIKSVVMKEIEGDKVLMPDLAQFSLGGKVIKSSPSRKWISWSVYRSPFLGLDKWNIPILNAIRRPFNKIHSDANSILNNDMTPGTCWSMQGSEGFALIQLAQLVRPHHFTIDHIPKELSLTPHAAPKDFAIYGYQVNNDTEIPLANFTFDYLHTTETFPADAIPEGLWFDRILVKVLSNHGNKESTCFYRFRVHGVAKISLEKQSVDKALDVLTILESNTSVEAPVNLPN